MSSNKVMYFALYTLIHMRHRGIESVGAKETTLIRHFRMSRIKMYNPAPVAKLNRRYIQINSL